MRDHAHSAVILAAGLGTRMRSKLPKVLHPLNGRPLIDLVLNACREAGLEQVAVVVNPSHEAVLAHLHGRVELVEQREQLGSGHALAQVPQELLEGRDVLVVNGDAPLLTAASLSLILAAHRGSAASATLASVFDPARRDGRVVRSADGSFERILEYRDASPADLAAYPEVNVGLYCFRGTELLGALARLRPDNSAGELYLVDVFRHLEPVEVVRLQDPEEAIGINDRIQLAQAEAILRRRTAERLMLQGVTVVDPASCFVDARVEVGQDTVIEPFSILRGQTVIGADCRIGPYAQIMDSEIGDGCRVERSWLLGSRLAAGSDCGPFAKLRPQVELQNGAHVGSFAELKNARIGAHSAVPHFSYVGDAVVGENVNIGAGTVTVNYDGVRKHQTEIGDGAFIGSDTMLRAPVRVGRGSRTGAGSVVTRDVPDGATAVGMPARVLRRKVEEKAG